MERDEFQQYVDQNGEDPDEITEDDVGRLRFGLLAADCRRL